MLVLTITWGAHIIYRSHDSVGSDTAHRHQVTIEGPRPMGESDAGIKLRAADILRRAAGAIGGGVACA